ncbi:hypothetical protein C8R44DRAFT_742233 [Mycena epipterygia]|nr:hypothetical protein C8R44DRAFT_742233 [Mycena epipterygia]
MPPQTNISQTWTRFTNIIECLALSVSAVNQLCTVLDAPFLKAASSTTASLLVAVQNTKRNKDECTTLMEQIHVVLQGIIKIHIKSYAGDVLPLATLDQIGKFTETLQKIYVFVEVQQDGTKLKHFFRQSETAALLKDCKAGLQNALNVFQVHNDLYVSNQIVNMPVEAQIKHETLLKVITGLSDGNSSEIPSIFQPTQQITYHVAEPKIFHGREAEVEHIITSVLIQEPARIAILGPGGIGKTSLARVVLHHPDITAKYQQCFFVSSESATTSSNLASLIGSTLGLKQQGRNLTTAIIQYFSDKPLCLLILDNLEIPWESADSRGNVEEFLALLTDISNLALIITMRGAERPAKVRWTRPFLQPLKPLTTDAARQTFIDIAGGADDHDIKQLLSLTDNLPLAVDLIAHLAAYESCSVVLARWEKEKTSLLSSGYDRGSNLDVSIALSLSSPRMLSSPGAKELLSLLSILPDGLSNNELLQSQLPIHKILACKANLLRTSLAYVDHDMRLKTLVPIREYMEMLHPPQPPLVHSLRKYFHELLELYTQYHGSPSGARVIEDIKSNLGNLQSVLLLGLKPDDPHLEQTVYCALFFNAFIRRSTEAHSNLMDHISTLAPQLKDHKLYALFIAEMFDSYSTLDVPNPDDVITQALEHFQHFNDLVLQAKVYIAAGTYYYQHLNDVSSAMKFLETALSLSKSCGDANGECLALFGISHINLNVRGDFAAAKRHAHEMARVAKLSGNLYTEARALRLEAMCLDEIGDFEESAQGYDRARKLLNMCGLSGTDMDFMIMLSQAAVLEGKSEYSEARKICA